MSKIIAILFFVFLWMNSTAQTHLSNTDLKLQLVKEVRGYLIDSLKLNVGEKFYTEFVDTDSMFYYVYVSQKDSVKKVTHDAYIYFGNYPTNAQLKADSFTQIGFDVMVYKTAGTSSAFLNKRLLQYDDLSLTFILIHEAIHRHKYNTGSKILYEYEEALCDVVANAYCGWMSHSSVKNYVDFVYRNEKIYQLINECAEFKITQLDAEKKIVKQLKQGTLFQNDRFNYPINNAFLLRYLNYSKHYFELAKWFVKKDKKIQSVKEYLAEQK